MKFLSLIFKKPKPPRVYITKVDRRAKPSINDALHRKLAAEIKAFKRAPPPNA